MIVGLNFAKQTVIVGFNFNTSNGSLILLLLIQQTSVNYVLHLQKEKNKILFDVLKLNPTITACLAKFNPTITVCLLPYIREER